MFFVDDGKADHFVKIELVAREWGQFAEGQVELRFEQVAALLGTHIGKLDDGGVALAVLKVLNHIGKQLSADVDKYRAEGCIFPRFVGVKIDDHLSLVTKGLADGSEVEEIFHIIVCYCSIGRGMSICSFHGRPYLPISAMNGSGSNCSMLKTPVPDHLPVSIILAPSMAGTPVV